MASSCYQRLVLESLLLPKRQDTTPNETMQDKTGDIFVSVGSKRQRTDNSTHDVELDTFDHLDRHFSLFTASQYLSITHISSAVGGKMLLDPVYDKVSSLVGAPQEQLKVSADVHVQLRYPQAPS